MAVRRRSTRTKSYQPTFQLVSHLRGTLTNMKLWTARQLSQLVCGGLIATARQRLQYTTFHGDHKGADIQRLAFELVHVNQL